MLKFLRKQGKSGGKRKVESGGRSAPISGGQRKRLKVAGGGGGWEGKSTSSHLMRIDSDGKRKEGVSSKQGRNRRDHIGTLLRKH